jgi:PAS domain S-box-containing protein
MNGQSIKILLVEDNPGDARLVRTMLLDRDIDESTQTIFELTHVERLSEAAKSLAKEVFDVILLDLSLPDGYGLDTVSQVRDAASDVPIVVMSGLSDEALAIKAVQKGAQDYLVKGHVDDYSLIRSLRYAIERKRIETAEREQRLLAETLTEVTLVLTSRVSHTEVLDEILRQVQRLVPYKAANIMLLEGETLRVARWQGYETYGGEEIFSNLIQPLTALQADTEVIQSGESIVISDTYKDPRWVVFDETAWVKSNLIIPICLRDRILGVLRLDSDSVSQFSIEDAQRLQPLTNAAAIALENAQLFEAEARRRREAETLREATAALTSALDLKQVLDNILIQLEKVIPYNSASVLLLQGENLHVVAGQGFENVEQIIGYSYPVVDDALFSEMQQTRWPLYLSDAQTDPRYSGWGDPGQVRGWMGVPLIVRDRVIGYLMLNGGQVAVYGETEASLAQAFANQAAVAIDNARLFETTKHHVAELEAIRQASLSLTSSLELEAVLEAILKSALNLLTGLQGARIYLYQADRLIFGAARWTDGIEGRSLEEPSPNGLTYTVARQGEPVVVPDMRAHPLYTSKPEREGAIVGLPLKIGERVVGVMNVECQQPRIWPETELRVLRLLADQAAIAIENARLYAKLDEYREHLEDLVQARTAELEQAMQETADARDKIDAILHSVADGLIVTDLDHRVILANPAAEELLGSRLEEMLGREVGAGIKDDRLREMVRYALDQRSSDYEIDIETESSQTRRPKVLRARTSSVDDQQGQSLGTVTIIQDVTRLREIDRLKTELLTTTAHALRTPLTSILGFSEILLTRKMDQDRQEYYLNLINEQSSHLAKVVEELVDLSRLEAGHGMELKLETVNVAELMEEVVVPFAEKTTKHNIQIKGLAELPPILGDPFRLTQVGQNLLSNAINFSPKGGMITICGRMTSDHLEISLQDEGIGMTAEQQEHLFRPFYRVDASDTAIGGTGLGLATAKLIIEQHGGEIWLESEPDLGTTVYFTLPTSHEKVLKACNSSEKQGQRSLSEQDEIEKT